PDRACLLALDVALEPGCVDRLDEELLADVEGQGEAGPLLRRSCGIADGELAEANGDGRQPRCGRRGQSTTRSTGGAAADAERAQPAPAVRLDGCRRRAANAAQEVDARRCRSYAPASDDALGGVGHRRITPA